MYRRPGERGNAGGDVDRVDGVDGVDKEKGSEPPARTGYPFPFPVPALFFGEIRPPAPRSVCALEGRNGMILARVSEPRRPAPPTLEAGLSQLKTEGIVLRKVDFGDTSAIVSFLTPDRGRIACLAKGMRGRKSALAPMLDTFNRVELVCYWKDGRSVQTLGEVSPLDAWAGLKRDLDRFAHAAFLLEICLHAAGEDAPSEVLYAALVDGLRALESAPDNLRGLAALAAYRLLAALGLSPELAACADTGRGPEAARWFSWEHGLSETLGNRRVGPEEVAALGRMASEGAPPAAGPPAEAVFELMARFTAGQLETDFRSLRVLRQVSGGVRPADA